MDLIRIFSSMEHGVGIKPALIRTVAKSLMYIYSIVSAVYCHHIEQTQ